MALPREHALVLLEPGDLVLSHHLKSLGDEHLDMHTKLHLNAQYLSPRPTCGTTCTNQTLSSLPLPQRSYGLSIVRLLQASRARSKLQAPLSLRTASAISSSPGGICCLASCKAC
eukprot:4335432-Amphidinium_carterae.1